MSTKSMHVHAEDFSPGSLSVNKNQDSVHFYRKDGGTATSVTITVPPGSGVGASTLFGTTTCTVDADERGTSLYAVQSGASGTYTVNLPSGPTGVPQTGSIVVNG